MQPCNHANSPPPTHTHTTPTAKQDLAMFSLKGLAAYAQAARAAGLPEDAEVNTFINGSVFATLTNVNFSDARFVEILQQADAYKQRLAAALAAKGAPGPATHDPATALGWAGCGLPHPADWRVPAGAGQRDLERLARQVGVDARQRSLGATLAGLQECLAYGIKGVAAVSWFSQFVAVRGGGPGATKQRPDAHTMQLHNQTQTQNININTPMTMTTQSQHTHTQRHVQYTHHADMLGARATQQYADIQDALVFLASPAARDVGAVLDKLLALGSAPFLRAGACVWDWSCVRACARARVRCCLCIASKKTTQTTHSQRNAPPPPPP